MLMTRLAGGAWFTELQVQPGSTMHVELHPSPFVVLPSSHPSWGNLSPSPQTAVHVPPAHLGSIVHVGEQPSYGTRLQSSHCSEPSFTQSPHTVLWQTDAGGVPMITQAQPGSIVHVALHASLLVPLLLPSSHCSFPATIPSPQ